MIYVYVHVQVRPEAATAFLVATQANAAASRGEPGVARFDVLQQAEDSTRFLLVEVYRDEDSTRAHKATAHYATWRDTVAPMMASPRLGVRYRDVSTPAQ